MSKIGRAAVVKRAERNRSGLVAPATWATTMDSTPRDHARQFSMPCPIKCFDLLHPPEPFFPVYRLPLNEFFTAAPAHVREEENHT